MKKILKKLISGAAALTVLVSSSAFCQISASAATSGNLTYTVDQSCVTITGCNKKAVNVAIPSMINGYPVTAIGKEAFKDCTKLKSVKMPKGLLKVDDNAFENCTELKSINFRMSTLFYGHNLFKGCTNLKSVIIDSRGQYNHIDVEDDTLPNNQKLQVGWNKVLKKPNMNSQNDNYTFMYGDANGDGRVTDDDAKVILQYYVEVLCGNITEQNEPKWYRNIAVMDIDRDGEVSCADAQWVLNWWAYAKGQWSQGKSALVIEAYMLLENYW